MASPTDGGYNPSASLLPNVGGTIVPMRGGGYDSYGGYGGYGGVDGVGGVDSKAITLLPEVSPVPIRAFHGGYSPFYGGNPPIDPAAAAAAAAAAAPTAPASEEKYDEHSPTIAAGIAAAAASAAASAASAPAPAPAAPVAASAAPVNPMMFYTMVPMVAAAAAAAQASQEPQAKQVQGQVQVQETPKVGDSKKKGPESQETKKEIIIFGESILLPDPSQSTRPFSPGQERALQLFGLDNAKDEDKQIILQLLYDSSCATDRNLIFLDKCEPIRQVIKRLALRLLENYQVESNSSAIDGTRRSLSSSLSSSLSLSPSSSPSLSPSISPSLPLSPSSSPSLSHSISSSPSSSSFSTSNVQVKPMGDGKSSVSITYTRNDVDALFSKAEADGEEVKVEEVIGDDAHFTKRGIPNSGVHCYCISVIQLLYSLPPVRHAILSYRCPPEMLIRNVVKKKEDVTPVDIVCVLQSIFKDLYKNKGSFDLFTNMEGFEKVTPINKLSRITFLVSHVFSNGKEQGRQQDALDMLRFLFDSMKAIPFLENMAKRFYSTEKSYRKCNNDPWTAGTSNTILDIPLYADGLMKNTSEMAQTYKNGYSGQSGPSVNNLLSYYEMEQPDPSNPSCKDAGKIKHEIKPHPMGGYLFLSVNRGQPMDRTIRVDVPTELSITSNGQPYAYHLFGIILYKGSGDGGHYRYRRFYYPSSVKSGMRMKDLASLIYNDKTVSRGSNAEDDIMTDSYLLVYQRRLFRMGKTLAPTGLDGITKLYSKNGRVIPVTKEEDALAAAAPADMQFNKIKDFSKLNPDNKLKHNNGIEMAELSASVAPAAPVAPSASPSGTSIVPAAAAAAASASPSASGTSIVPAAAAAAASASASPSGTSIVPAAAAAAASASASPSGTSIVPAAAAAAASASSVASPKLSQAVVDEEDDDEVDDDEVDDDEVDDDEVDDDEVGGNNQAAKRIAKQIVKEMDGYRNTLQKKLRQFNRFLSNNILSNEDSKMRIDHYKSELKEKLSDELKKYSKNNELLDKIKVHIQKLKNTPPSGGDKLARWQFDEDYNSHWHKLLDMSTNQEDKKSLAHTILSNASMAAAVAASMSAEPIGHLIELPELDEDNKVQIQQIGQEEQEEPEVTEVQDGPEKIAHTILFNASMAAAVAAMASAESFVLPIESAELEGKYDEAPPVASAPEALHEVVSELDEMSEPNKENSEWLNQARQALEREILIKQLYHQETSIKKARDAICTEITHSDQVLGNIEQSNISSKLERAKKKYLGKNIESLNQYDTRLKERQATLREERAAKEVEQASSPVQNELTVSGETRQAWKAQKEAMIPPLIEKLISARKKVIDMYNAVNVVLPPLKREYEDLLRKTENAALATQTYIQQKEDRNKKEKEIPRWPFSQSNKYTSAREILGTLTKRVVELSNVHNQKSKNRNKATNAFLEKTNQEMTDGLQRLYDLNYEYTKAQLEYEVLVIHLNVLDKDSIYGISWDTYINEYLDVAGSIYMTKAENLNKNLDSLVDAVHGFPEYLNGLEKAMENNIVELSGRGFTENVMRRIIATKNTNVQLIKKLSAPSETILEGIDANVTLLRSKFSVEGDPLEIKVRLGRLSSQPNAVENMMKSLTDSIQQLTKGFEALRSEKMMSNKEMAGRMDYAHIFFNAVKVEGELYDVNKMEGILKLIRDDLAVLLKPVDDVIFVPNNKAIQNRKPLVPPVIPPASGSPPPATCQVEDKLPPIIAESDEKADEESDEKSVPPPKVIADQPAADAEVVQEAPVSPAPLVPPLNLPKLHPSNASPKKKNVPIEAPDDLEIRDNFPIPLLLIEARKIARSARESVEEEKVSDEVQALIEEYELLLQGLEQALRKLAMANQENNTTRKKNTFGAESKRVIEKLMENINVIQTKLKNLIPSMGPKTGVAIQKLDILLPLLMSSPFSKGSILNNAYPRFVLPLQLEEAKIEYDKQKGAYDTASKTGNTIAKRINGTSITLYRQKPENADKIQRSHRRMINAEISLSALKQKLVLLKKKDNGLLAEFKQRVNQAGLSLVSSHIVKSSQEDEKAKREKAIEEMEINVKGNVDNTILAKFKTPQGDIKRELLDDINNKLSSFIFALSTKLAPTVAFKSKDNKLSLQIVISAFFKEFEKWKDNIYNNTITEKGAVTQLDRLVEFITEAYNNVKREEGVSINGVLEPVYRITYIIQSLQSDPNINDAWRALLRQAQKVVANKKAKNNAERQAEEKREFNEASQHQVYQTLVQTWKYTEELVDYVQENFPRPTEYDAASAEARLEQRSKLLSVEVSSLLNSVMELRRVSKKTNKAFMNKQEEYKKQIAENVEIVKGYIIDVQNVVQQAIKSYKWGNSEKKVQDLKTRIQTIGENVEKIRTSLSSLFIVIKGEQNTNVTRNQKNMYSYRTKLEATRKKKKDNAEDAQRKIINARKAEQARRESEAEAARLAEEARKAEEEKRAANEARRQAEAELAKKTKQETLALLQKKKEVVKGLVQTLREKERNISDKTAEIKLAKRAADKLRSDHEIMDRKYAAISIPAAKTEKAERTRKASTKASKTELEKMTPEKYIDTQRDKVSELGKQVHAEEAKQEKLSRSRIELEQDVTRLQEQIEKAKEDLQGQNTENGYAEWEKQLPTALPSMLTLNQRRNALNFTLRGMKKKSINGNIVALERTKGNPATAEEVIQRLERKYTSQVPVKKGGSRNVSKRATKHRRARRHTLKKRKA